MAQDSAPLARLPVIALVGRPNVGKSTLFNALTNTRDALVADTPGLTRDRQYGFAEHAGRRFIVVDTAGLDDSADVLSQGMRKQTAVALAEADAVILMTDARSGLTSADQVAAMDVRRSTKPTLLAVNKAEGLDATTAGAEFFELGIEYQHAVSATNGAGVRALMNQALQLCPPSNVTAEQDSQSDAIRIAIVGRPNVGKSTLVNRLLGEERVLTMDMPGTTRDAIRIPFERDGRQYLLIDTAGVRRRARVREHIEKFSIVKTLQAMDSAHVIIVVVDARGDLGVQDARLLGLAADSGRALVLAVNKWDGLDTDARKQLQSQVDFKLPHLDYAPPHFISALHGSGLGELFAAVNQAYAAATAELPTPAVTRVLERAVEKHAPPALLGRRIKLRYAHQGGSNPPLIVIHGNQVDKLGVDYKRYLMRAFREAFDLWGTPIQLVFKHGDNPYAGRTRQPPRHKRGAGGRKKI